jgi:hypothetical protein
MRCKRVEVLPSIFAQDEPLRMKMWNGCGELAIHELYFLVPVPDKPPITLRLFPVELLEIAT